MNAGASGVGSILAFGYPALAQGRFQKFKSSSRVPSTLTLRVTDRA
jgi:hypothetical protein